MNKIWFILINGKREGPFSHEELKSDRRLTPDTMVWKEGFKEWKKIRDVPDLKKVFEDEVNEDENEEDENEEDWVGSKKKKTLQDELVLDMGQEPPVFLWILIALIILLYMMIRLYN